MAGRFRWSVIWREHPPRPDSFLAETRHLRPHGWVFAPSAGKMASFIHFGLEMTALEQAYQHHREGRLKEAEQGYRAVLKQEGDHPDALHFLGVIHHQKGELERAENWIRRAIKAAPEHGAAWNSLAAVQLENQQIEAAEQSVRKALELDPNLHEAWLNLAQIQLRQRQMEAAMETLETALKIEPDDLAAQHLMGQLLVERGQLEQGLKYLQSAADRQKDDPALLAATARAMVLTGAHATAAALLDRAVLLRPEFHAAWCLATHALVRNGQLDEARGTVEQARKLKPDHPLTRSAEAVLAAGTGDWPTVLEKLKPIAAAPDAEILDLRNLAMALGYSGFYRDAAAIHERMARHVHATAADWRAFLEALAFTGQHHRRGPAVEEALGRFPEDTGLQQHAALYYTEAMQYDRARPLFAALREKQALSVPVRLAEISVLLRGDQPEAALKALDELAAVPEWKPDVNALLLRARVLDRLERYPEAEEHLQAAQGALAQLLQDGEQRREQVLRHLQMCRDVELPEGLSAERVEDSPVQVLLLAALPGSGLGQLLRQLQHQGQVQLLTDRITGQNNREDFISQMQTQAEDVVALNRLKKRYFAQIRALGGLQAGTLVVDVLPLPWFFNPLIRRVLPEATRLWVGRDLRDLQLHQRFFALEYLPLGVQAPGQVAELLQPVTQLLRQQDDIQQRDGQVWIDQPAQALEDLRALTGLALESAGTVPAGDYLPAGHWQHYHNGQDG